MNNREWKVIYEYQYSEGSGQWAEDGAANQDFFIAGS